VLSTININKH